MMLLKAFKYVMLIAVNLAALFAGISAAPLPNDFGQNYVVVKKPELHAAKVIGTIRTF